MRESNQLGVWGESLASGYLREHGYEVLEANFRSRFGEIDLIARKGGYVAFVEVKLRASSHFAEAREFVGAAKQRRLRSTAMLWLSRHGTEEQPRFDVIEIYAPDGLRTKHPHIEHLENAFE